MIRDWWEQGATRIVVILIFACCMLVLAYVIVTLLPFGRITFSLESEQVVATSTSLNTQPVFVATHISTPSAVKAIYMTACTASEKTLRDKVLAVIHGTEINSIIIDYKDYSGTISYASTTLQTAHVGKGCRIYDLPEFITELHAKKIYAISRVTTFQDPAYAQAHIDVAIRSKMNPNTTWKDVHGLAYIDPGATKYWNYVVDMAKESYAIGFDEVNFDYVRFPSDGKLADMLYAHTASTTKADTLKDFFQYLHFQLASTSIVTSADLFGLTTSAEGDMGIGQILENTLPYFDYVAPMVYPSHFAAGFQNFAKPAEHPYEVVNYSMIRAVERAIAASTTPSKLRPWIQAFDLGAVYTPTMVRDQMRATYDSGLTSWMIWNASSSYKKEYLLPASK